MPGFMPCMPNASIVAAHDGTAHAMDSTVVRIQENSILFIFSLLLMIYTGSNITNAKRSGFGTDFIEFSEFISFVNKNTFYKKQEAGVARGDDAI